MQTDMDLDSGAPKDELHLETIEWLKTHGLEYTKLSEVLAAGPCPKVRIFRTHSHDKLRLLIRFDYPPHILNRCKRSYKRESHAPTNTPHQMPRKFRSLPFCRMISPCQPANWDQL